MKVVKEDIWLCDDCLFAAVNDDYSGLDCARAGEIREGLRDLGPNLVPDFDCDTQDGIREISRSRCDCCGERLHGRRHRFAALE